MSRLFIHSLSRDREGAVGLSAIGPAPHETLKPQC